MKRFSFITLIMAAACLCGPLKAQNKMSATQPLYDKQKSIVAAVCVKPYCSFTQVGQPINGQFVIDNAKFFFSRVNFNASLIGGIAQTQQVMNHCAENKIYPQIQMIKASEINDAWEKVVSKEARYRFVIDMATI